MSSGRFAIVEVPSALPGSCKCCGSASKKFYIDTGTQEEFYGAVYYCNDCMGEMAELAGYVTPIANLKIVEMLEELLAEREDTLTKVEEVINAVSNGLKFDNPSVTNDHLLETVRSLKQKLSRGTSELGEGTGTPPESSNDEGMAELRSTVPELKLDFSTGI